VTDFESVISVASLAPVRHGSPYGTRASASFVPKISLPFLLGCPQLMDASKSPIEISAFAGGLFRSDFWPQLVCISAKLHTRSKERVLISNQI